MGNFRITGYGLDVPSLIKHVLENGQDSIRTEIHDLLGVLVPPQKVMNRATWGTSPTKPRSNVKSSHNNLAELAISSNSPSSRFTVHDTYASLSRNGGQNKWYP